MSPEIFERGMFNDDIREISPHDLPDFEFPVPLLQAMKQLGNSVVIDAV